MASVHREAATKVSTARLAQSVEHETLNLRVVGSSPTLGAHFFKHGLPATTWSKIGTVLLFLWGVHTRAPWLSWLKRLSSKQEIPSSNLGVALVFVNLSQELTMLLLFKPGS